MQSQVGIFRGSRRGIQINFDRAEIDGYVAALVCALEVFEFGGCDMWISAVGKRT